MKDSRPAAVACALVLLTAVGCAQTPPSDFYVLSSMAATQTSSGAQTRESLSIGVGPVKIPEYLNRTQIVTRTGRNRLDVNEFNRWGGSLASNITGVVAENLSVLMGTDEVFVFPTQDPIIPRYRVILSVTRFDGTLGDRAELDARWLITGPRRREQLATGRTKVQELPAGSDYAAYVAAQSRALEALSREIAAELVRLHDAGR